MALDPKILNACALRTDDTPGASPAPTEANDDSRRLSGIHVLIVDDDPDNREALQSLLEDCGSRITTAADVPDALAKFERDVPDVLLSDIGMPGEDGYDLIRHVRARSKARGGRVPAAALTGRGGRQDRHKALRAGFMKHVVKPVTATELITLVYSLAQIVT